MMKEISSLLYQGGCRTFQIGLKVFNSVLDYRMPDYIEGPGSVLRVKDILKTEGKQRVFIVTDPNLKKLGLLDPMCRSLTENGIAYDMYSEVSANPTVDNVEAALKVYRKHPGQPLLAFGGGSPMDCAKAAAARYVHPHRTVTQLQGILRVHKPLPLLIAVPTTAGTGSETTAAAVITDTKTHHKASINDPVLIPRIAVLDPQLTAGLPPKVTATTGMDALCHAVESYCNHTYNTELEDFLAKEAVRLIHENLLQAYHDGSDLEARGNMQKAAFFAGRSFTRGMVGYVHAVGHTLGGLYGMPHGLAMSIILPHVLHQYGSVIYDRLDDLAAVCGIEGRTKVQRAQNFIAWIEDMKKEMHIPDGIDCILDEDVEQIIDWAMAEANPLYPTPVIWEREDFRKLIDTLRRAGEGEEHVDTGTRA